MSDLFDSFEEAAQRLKARGDAPPWEVHPGKLHRELYEADELSKRYRTMYEDHMKTCVECRKVPGKKA